MDHSTGKRIRWLPSKEQYAIWRSIYYHGWTFILKPRQVGATTAFVFEMVIWILAMDARGERVNVASFIDTSDKADALRDRAIDFFEQIGVDVVSKQGKLTLPNGSNWFFATAGSKRAAASLSLHRVHLTELPFWKNPTAAYNSIMPSLSLGGWAVIDTTMGVDDPIGRNLWYESHRYNKVFFSVEDHDTYRAPVDTSVLTKEKWEWLRGEGFTMKTAAMWWLLTLSDRCAGDIPRCWREYPQLPSHAFKYAEGNWINGVPELADVVDEFNVPNTLRPVQVFIPPSDCSSRLVGGVDTSFGMGQDACSVSLVNQAGELVASWRDNGALIDTTVDVLADIQQLFTKGGEAPLGVIETNGVGAGTLQRAEQKGLVVVGENMDAAKKQLGMLGVKRGIESGTLKGGKDLQDECKELRVRNNRWLGPKDLLMSIGFAYRELGLCDGIWLEHEEPPDEVGPNVFSLKERMGDHGE